MGKVKVMKEASIEVNASGVNKDASSLVFIAINLCPLNPVL